MPRASSRDVAILKYIRTPYVAQNMKPSASVIIPSLGRRTALGKCVESVVSQECAQLREIILSIDGHDSKDIATEISAGFGDRIPINTSTSTIRRGSPKAKNDGAALATGDIVVFIDDDTIASPGWLQSMVDSYEEGVSGVGGSEQKTGPTSILRRLAFMAHRNATGKVTKYGNVISNFTPNKCGREQVDCLAGANMSFLRTVFNECGGFDENYRGNAYREETDLSLRVGRTARLVFSPEAMVLHLEEPQGGNSSDSIRNWNYWYHRNNTYFYLSNFRPDLLHWAVHILSEMALALGRCLMQRSMYPIITASRGIAEGKTAANTPTSEMDRQ